MGFFLEKRQIISLQRWWWDVAQTYCYQLEMYYFPTAAWSEVCYFSYDMTAFVCYFLLTKNQHFQCMQSNVWVLSYSSVPKLSAFWAFFPCVFQSIYYKYIAIFSCLLSWLLFFLFRHSHFFVFGWTPMPELHVTGVKKD